MTQKPTPKTHPNAFVAVPLVDGTMRYYCKVITVGIQENLCEAYQARYTALFPEECKDGFNNEKYSAWLYSEAGKQESNHVAASVLFVTEDGEPSDPDVFLFVGADDFGEAFNFTMRPLPTKGNSPKASTAITASSPATALNSSK
jgi:hypothetical protein